MNSVLDGLYGNLIAGIAAGTQEDARRRCAPCIDQGPFLAKQALADGLVDELRYEDQMFGELQQKVNPAKSTNSPPRDT